MAEAVHACPPEGSGLTPCCHRTPFELPNADRMTAAPSDVTCRRPVPAADPDEIAAAVSALTTATVGYLNAIAPAMAQLGRTVTAMYNALAEAGLLEPGRPTGDREFVLSDSVEEDGPPSSARAAAHITTTSREQQ
jgi:hypothetical protein